MKARRGVAVAVVVAGALTACSFTTPTERARHARRPNILIVVTDDQRLAGTLAVMPATRRLFRREGTRFTEAYTVTPACCPSRATLMTGRYPHNHGVINNQSVGALDHRSTIQSYLHESGYSTGVVGKFLNNWPSAKAPPFFDDWAIHTRGPYYGGAKWNVDGTLRRVDAYSTNFIRRRATQLIRSWERDDGRPWFLYVAPMAPHAPSIPAPEYRSARVPPWRQSPATREHGLSDKPPYAEQESATLRRARYVRAKHLRTLMSVDDMVQSIFRTLRQHNEDRPTLAVFVSDSGFLWGEHRLVQKRNVYSETIKVPLFVRWNSHVAAGGKDARFVATIDVAPTILQAAGVAADPAYPMDGRSLFSEDEVHSRLLIHGPGRGIFSSRTTEYQYTEYSDDTGMVEYREYYDLTKDPWQLTNLFGDSDPTNDPDLVGLSTQLAEDRTCLGQACP